MVADKQTSEDDFRPHVKKRLEGRIESNQHGTRHIAGYGSALDGGEKKTQFVGSSSILNGIQKVQTHSQKLECNQAQTVAMRHRERAQNKRIDPIDKGKAHLTYFSY